MRWLGALLPLAMTGTIVATALIHAAQAGGFVREADEGTAAHLFQLLMPAQVPIMAVFVATQLPRHPVWTLSIFGLQLAAAAGLFAAVFVFEHQ